MNSTRGAGNGLRPIGSETAVRVPALDGLRGLSILLVVVGHAVATRGFPAAHQVHDILWPMGRFGVHIFFVISGYIITSLLLKEQGRTGEISLKAFYLRRVLRL